MLRLGHIVCVRYLVLSATALYRMSAVVQSIVTAPSHPMGTSESDLVEVKRFLGLPLWGKRDESPHVRKCCCSHQG